MASRPVMLLGNLASIILSAAAILQALSWTIAGAVIIAVLSITTLVPTRLGARTSPAHSISKKTHSVITEPRTGKDKTQEKQSPKQPRQSLREDLSRVSPQSKTESQTPPPKIDGPKVIPTSASPTKQTITKPSSLKPEVKLTPVGTSAGISTTIKTVLPKLDPNTRIITKGDYSTYDLDLSQKTEVTCDVTATGPVNVYILDTDNLNSLDLGEEFWSEGGEEGVQKTTLRFVAPQNGKWFLVVENTGDTEVSAKAIVHKSISRTARAN